MKKVSLYSVSTIAMFSVLNSPVFAQEQVNNNETLGEIVVTARKKSEDLQQTPISITALSAASIEEKGINRTDDIMASTPNLILRNDAGSSGATSAAAIFIRGVGQKEYLAGLEPGVGLYVDGVYLARNAGAVLDLADLERIEVLRGPQGTLFGRNTIGGAISITSAQPSGEFKTKATLTYGSDNQVNFIGTINVPLSDTVFVRTSAGLFKRDGYIDRPFDGTKLGNDNRLTGRLAIRFEPSSDFDATISFDGTRIRENGPPALLRSAGFASRIFNPQGLPVLPPGSPPTTGFYVLNPPGPNGPGDLPVDNFSLYHNYVATYLSGQNCISGFFAPYNPENGSGNPACFSNQFATEGQRVNLGSAPAFSDFDIWGGSLILNYDFGPVALKSITAYRETSAKYGTDNDGSPLLISQFLGELEQSQFSQEFNITGNSLNGLLDWVIGAFYMREKASNPEPVGFAALSLLASAGELGTTSLAGFAQGTFSVTDKLKLTAGVRYTRDKKSYDPDQFITEDRTGGALPVGTRLVPRGVANNKFNKFTMMANLAYQFTPDFMVYGTFSQGFKSGGYNQRIFPPRAAVLAFGEESINSYEGGFKWTSNNGKIRLNAAGYYSDYSDIQVSVIEGIAPVTQNGGDARIQGLELELNVIPWDGGRLEGGVGLTDAKFTTLAPNIAVLTLNSEFDRTPKWNLNAALSQKLEASWGSITPRASWTYRSREFQDAENSPEILQPSVHLVDVGLTWRDTSEAYSLSFNVANLFDETIINGFNDQASQIFTVYPNRGREWSLTVRSEF